jgi:hypothetical protein
LEVEVEEDTDLLLRRGNFDSRGTISKEAPVKYSQDDLPR